MDNYSYVLYANELCRLTKDELIYLLCDFDTSLALISETLVDLSKSHISNEACVNQIRKYCEVTNKYDFNNPNDIKLKIKLLKGGS
jgi:hypothetical protein